MLHALRRAFSKPTGIHDTALELRKIVDENFGMDRENIGDLSDTGGKKPSPRGRGGKNEAKLLRAVVDEAMHINSERGELNEFRTLSGPINLNGGPHLGVMANTLLRDCNLRFELLRGKHIENWVRNL